MCGNGETNTRREDCSGGKGVKKNPALPGRTQTKTQRALRNSKKTETGSCMQISFPPSLPPPPHVSVYKTVLFINKAVDLEITLKGYMSLD